MSRSRPEETYTMKISVARDFSRTPGSRYVEEGDFSGELFRVQTLQPAIVEALHAGGEVNIDLDGTAGFGTSFLEEAFGGLIRDGGFTGPDVLRILTFTSHEEPYLIDDIRGYINDAEQARASTPTGRQR
jgi:hypothetical protein